ncbi:MAG: hypothetical protein GQ527_04565 [Bacteroidales bacterium]|nr:hypothetical protein [Bacteroidales bacterium]
MKKTVLLFLAFIFISLTSFSQTFKTPSEGKTLVYFTRVGTMGFAINFRYFDGEKYIGKFNGNQYYVYECEPGEHTFWASSENMSVVDANLEAGKVYIIDAKAKSGAFKANVELIPLDKNHKKYEKHKSKILAELRNATEVSFEEAELLEEQEELQEEIAKGVRYFNALKKHHMEYPIITPDMYYSGATSD